MIYSGADLRDRIPIAAAVLLMAMAAAATWRWLSHAPLPSQSHMPTAQRVAILPPPPPPVAREPTAAAVPRLAVPVPAPTPAPKPVEKEPVSAPSTAGLPVDAVGSGSGNAFGIVGNGSGGTRIGGSASGFFVATLQRNLREALERIPTLRSRRYSAVVRLWIDEGGRVTRCEIVHGSGDADVDASLRAALSDKLVLGVVPPADLPQPVKLEISSRN